MKVTLRYFDDCPNWRIAAAHLGQLGDERGDLEVVHERVESDDEAQRLDFHGSPTVLVDGVDLFGRPDGPAGMSCRMYVTPDGLAGSPTLEQLRAALDQA